MKDKRYKAGQLVTIDCHVFRIRQRNYRGFRTCDICERVNGEAICRIKSIAMITNRKIYEFCCNLPYGYYLERIL